MKEMEDKLSTLEIRDEDESTRVRKLSKILEKYKLELNEAHVEMRQLRARLLEAADLKASYSSCPIAYQTHQILLTVSILLTMVLQ